MTYQAFSMVPSKAALDETLGHSAFRVLCILATYRNSKDGWCYPSLTTIGDHMGLSFDHGKHQVSKAIKELRDKGYIKQVIGGGREASRYQVILDEPDFDNAALVKNTNGGLAENTNAALVKDTNRTILYNQTNEPNILNVEFDEFWKKYPYRVSATGVRTKNGKPAAKRQFALARKKVEFGTIMSTLSRFILATDPKYVPDAERWLKHGRWEDEFLIAEAKKENLFGSSL